MRMILHTFLAGGALALGMASFAATAASPPAMRTPLSTPAKLWDGFSSPVGMAFDATGNLYVAEWAGQGVFLGAILRAAARPLQKVSPARRD